MENKGRLDNKSTTGIATAGTIVTLFMGFGIFLMKDIDPEGLFFIPAMVVMLAEIIVTVITIRHSVLAYRLTGYFFPLNVQDFMNDEKNPNTEKIKKYLKAPQDKIEIALAKIYLECIRDNESKLTEKIKDIDKSQNYLLLGISLIPVFAFVIILAKYSI